MYGQRLSLFLATWCQTFNVDFVINSQQLGEKGVRRRKHDDSLAVTIHLTSVFLSFCFRRARDDDLGGNLVPFRVSVLLCSLYYRNYAVIRCRLQPDQTDRVSESDHNLTALTAPNDDVMWHEMCIGRIGLHPDFQGWSFGRSSLQLPFQKCMALQALLIFPV